MKNVIELAKQAGIEFQQVTGITGKSHVMTMGSTPLEKIERLVQLVAEHEREMCAKVCDEHEEYPSLTPRHCAEAIRARGQS